jgi:hypothetical protein
MLIVEIRRKLASIDELDPDDLWKWMFDTFPNASGQIAVNGNIATLNRLGLWLQQDNMIRLTPEGTTVVTKADSDPAAARRTILEIKHREFLGYKVLFELCLALKQANAQAKKQVL